MSVSVLAGRAPPLDTFSIVGAPVGEWEGSSDHRAHRICCSWSCLPCLFPLPAPVLALLVHIETVRSPASIPPLVTRSHAHTARALLLLMSPSVTLASVTTADPMGPTAPPTLTTQRHLLETLARRRPFGPARPSAGAVTKGSTMSGCSHFSPQMFRKSLCKNCFQKQAAHVAEPPLTTAELPLPPSSLNPKPGLDGQQQAVGIQGQSARLPSARPPHTQVRHAS
jgi:hypothetical protein